MSLPKFYRALQLRQPGGIHEFEMVQRALRAPNAGEVLIKVRGCAIAYRDVLDRKGAFKFIQQPSVLGHEFSGTVVQRGSDCRSLLEGDNVVSFHWDQNAAWPSPLKAASAVDSMFGLTCDGGYAEYVVAREGAFGLAPRHIPLEDASCVVSTFGTVWHASIAKCGLKPGQRVLVTGASGGVGSAAVKLFRAFGCHVVGVTSTANKAQRLETEVGCHEVLVASNNGQFKLKAPVDHVLEAVGGPTFASSLRAVKPGGSLALVGNVENSVVNLPLGFCILNSIQIIGSDSIPRLQFEEQLLPFMEKHDLKPIVAQRIALEGIPNGHEELEKRSICGRIVAVL